MKQVEHQTVTVPVVTDVLCDRCDRSTKVEGVPEFGTLAAHWETPHPDWGQILFWDLHLCKECWHSLVPTFLSPERLEEARTRAAESRLGGDQDLDGTDPTE